MKKFLAVLVLAIGFLALGHASPTLAANAADFKPGRIIDDAIFFNKDAMGVADIQSFLNAQVPTCDTWRAYSGKEQPPWRCLKDYYENPTTKENNLDGRGTPAGGISAAQIIYNAGQEYSINPQALIVLLQKEQSLITDNWPFDAQYRSATGMGCPDTAACDSQYYGFYNQVRSAARQFRLYANNPGSYNHKAGVANNILYSPNAGCGTKNVFIENQATAGLYNYTPYTPNQAALNNLYGSGDGCSAYGNRNFWRIFTDWFGPTTESYLFKVGSSPTYYLEWGDNYYPIPSEDVLKAYGLHYMAPRSLSAFPAGKNQGAILSRSAKFGTDAETATVYLVDGGKKLAAPNWSTLYAHGITSYTNYHQSLGWLLRSGEQVRPLARRQDGAVFAMETGKKRIFPDLETYQSLSGPNYTGATQIYSQQELVNMSEEYFSSRPDGAPVLLDGKYIKAGSPAIYLYDRGAKRAFDPDTYSSWGKKLDYTFSEVAISQIPSASNLPARVKSSSGTKYLVDSGKKKQFDGSSQAAWGFSDESFIEMSDRALARLTPANASLLIKPSDSSAVFMIRGGRRHWIPTPGDFSALNLNWSNVDTVSGYNASQLAGGSDAYGAGSLIRKPDGAVYLVDLNFNSQLVPSLNVFNRFGFEWSAVRNVTVGALNDYTVQNLAVLLRENMQYYAVEGGGIRYVPASLAGPTHYNFVSKTQSTVSASLIQKLKVRSELSYYIRGSGPTVYFVENGQRRGFATQSSFYNHGGAWNKVTDVSDQFLQEFPEGSVMP